MAPLLRVLAAVLLMAGGSEGMRIRRASSLSSGSVKAVRKPLTDHRQYQYSTFEENGLKVLAVQDPHAAKAGFAVAVEAGSFSDPAELPGLAHFCEHLLFLGTKKYPDEASFDNFMAQHDGTNNAFTEPERTVFYNEVSHGGFEEGMDRFAQFFVAPLFKSEMVGRELNAVNSEHEKNKPDQGRRLWEIMRGTAKPESVLSRFYTGTLDSLHHGDATTVAALRKYHDANYCAPRMNLVMVSNLTTAQQLAIARQTFSAVPRGQCGPTPDFRERTGSPFDAAHLGQYIQLGTESTPTLWMMFPLPPTLKLYKAAPLQYLEYVLGYAGPHSLKSRLKKRELINGLDLQLDQSTVATIVFVMFDLTATGAEQAGIQEIAKSTFNFLRLVRDDQADVPSVYDSLQRMSKVSFDYLEAPDSVMDASSDLAAAMSQFPPEDLLTGSNGVVDQIDLKSVKSLITAMADPTGVNLAFAAPSFNATAANHFEKYYDIHFKQEKIPELWTREWAEQPLQLDMKPPPPLGHVPSNLTVRSKGPENEPEMLDTRGPLELWWKGVDEFALPKAQLRLRLGLPVGRPKDATQEALRKLHTELAGQMIEEATDELRNCGLDFEISPSGDGYRLQFSGYDQHLGDLVLQALEGLMDPQFGSAEFAHSHRKVIDEISDTTRSAPYELAMEAMSALTTDDVFGREEVIAELKKIDEKRLRNYISSLQSGGLRAQLLVVGNIDRSTARVLAEKVGKSIVGVQKGKLQAPVGRLLTAAEAQTAHVLAATSAVEVRLRNPIPGDDNSATVNSYQYGVPDVPERVRLLLLGKMIENPVYEALRTKKQLGYVVFGFVTDHHSVLELRVIVQGAKELPDAVDADIEEVLTNFGSQLRNMSTAEFLKWKGSLRSALNHKDQNMGQEADRYWAQIVNDGHCFHRKDLALQYLETLQSADEVAQTFDTILHRHRKVSVKMFGAGANLTVVQESTAPSAGMKAKAQGSSLAVLHLNGVDTAQKQRLSELGGAKATYPVGEICGMSSK